MGLESPNSENSMSGNAAAVMVPWGVDFRPRRCWTGTCISLRRSRSVTSPRTLSTCSWNAGDALPRSCSPARRAAPEARRVPAFPEAQGLGHRRLLRRREGGFPHLLRDHGNVGQDVGQEAGGGTPGLPLPEFSLAAAGQQKVPWLAYPLSKLVNEPYYIKTNVQSRPEGHTANTPPSECRAFDPLQVIRWS